MHSKRFALSFLTKAFISPADPSIAYYPAKYPLAPSDFFHSTSGDVSYAPNAFALESAPRMTDISDGTSSTIFFAEHYARCGTAEGTQFGADASPSTWSPTLLAAQTRVNAFAYHHFIYKDVYPVVGPSGTTGSRPNATFQVAPHPPPAIPRSSKHRIKVECWFFISTDPFAPVVVRLRPRSFGPA